MVTPAESSPAPTAPAETRLTPGPRLTIAAICGAGGAMNGMGPAPATATPHSPMGVRG
ncbi:hypothetical protein ACIBRY_03640 [Streptomyces anulatus]